MSQLASLCLAGDFSGAREVHRRYLPLMEINFVEANPGPVKAALAMMGLLELEYRLPMVPPRSDSQAKIEKVLELLGLLAARAVQYK
jgi:4-hydroxy-tetrahydrodipicolinate synthase